MAGGTLAGTAAVCALSSGTASAAESQDHPAADHALSTVFGQPGESPQAPDLGALTDGGGRELTEQIRQKTTRAVHDVGSSVQKSVEPVLDETAKHVERAVAPVTHPKRDLDDVAGDVGSIVDGVRDTLDGIGSQLPEVENPLEPITEPITQPVEPSHPQEPIHRAPTQDHDAEHTGQHAPRQHGPVTVGQPAPQHHSATTISAASLHLPAGGLPADTGTDGGGQPVAPRTVPSNPGTGHDGSSSHTSVAGEYSAGPRIAEPAPLSAVRATDHRVNVTLADQPGTTPD